MPRSLVALVAIFNLSGLSCAIFSPPPALRAQAPITAVADRPAEIPVPPAMKGFLEARLRGLTDAEVDALARTIIVESKRYRIDPLLVLAVMKVESRFSNFAVSPVGALGLMQILPSTGEELAAQQGITWHGPHTLFDPVTNVKLGILYLRELSDRFGHLPTVLAAYNWGPGHIGRRLRRGTSLPTEYPNLVFEAYDDQGDLKS